MKETSQYIKECSELAAESMGSDFLSVIEALNNALYIGKYLKSNNKTYKKDKRNVKKVLKSTENGYFVKYMNEWDFSDE